MSKRVFHFSGGRSSAYQVLLGYQKGDVVIFCDTGREDPDTLRFVKEFSEYENIPVICLKGDWRIDVIKKRSTIPNKFKRKCTEELKIKLARRYLRSIGWYRYTQFIGFRHDEPRRVRDYKDYWQAVETRFLLDEMEVSKPEIILYFKSKPYNLRIPAILGNCDGCFLKGQLAVMTVYQHYPEKADKWIEDEENKILNKKGHTYFPGVTHRQLRDQALKMKAEGNILLLEEATPALNCTCSA